MKPPASSWPADLSIEVNGFGVGAPSFPTPQSANSLTCLTWEVIATSMTNSGVGLRYMNINEGPERSRHLAICHWPTVRVLIAGKEVARSTCVWMRATDFRQWLLDALHDAGLATKTPRASGGDEPAHPKRVVAGTLDERLNMRKVTNAEAEEQARRMGIEPRPPEPLFPPPREGDAKS